MGPLDVFWHLLNLFAPAAGVALVTTVFAKLLWRQQLASAGWLRLWCFGAAAGAVVLVAGLAWFGHDGKMATYAALVVATALGLWWAGFMRPR